MKTLTALFGLLVFFTGATPARAEVSMAVVTAKWFGPGTTLKPLGTNGVEKAVKQVLGADGRVRGWVFRTDEVPPAVKGMRGEIGVLTGLGTDQRITGVEVMAHREDLKWFNMLRAPFYRQFEKLPAKGGDKPVDTVTGATVSSRAIIKDVQSACQTVLALPGVQAALAP